jgi:alkyl hydroperoxide reductase subunit F
MLDQDLKDQLRGVFSGLESGITLVYDDSNHENQSELTAMLEGLTETCSKIAVKKSGRKLAAPSFEIQRTINGQDRSTGIRFLGIPGGHEFTSLVLAILNSDGKGKIPDDGMKARIRAIRGPVRIKTFMSLTCENCPEVVQALNQMALIHPDFQHEVIDGAYAQEEIDRLGIQGVPSVVVGDKMIHSGRIHFLDLLAKVEETFGADEAAATAPRDLGTFDVVVVGGGPAGVSAAIYSVRKGLKTALLAERMGGQVQDTKGIENLISVVYTEGPKLGEDMAKHLASYPVQILNQRRVKSISKDRVISLEGGETLRGEAIIITTGAKWRQLGVPGEKEYIGRGVAYCPHCDGPFYKGKKLAVIGGGNSGVEAAIDLAGIAGEVVLLEYGEKLRADQVLIDKLSSMSNTSAITMAQTTELKGNGQKIHSLDYTDRKSGEKKSFDVDGVFIQIGLLPNSEFLKGTLELSKFGEIIVDEKGRTSVPGIYAAGDVTTTPFKQIIIAMGEGAKASLAAFEDRMRGELPKLG